MTADFIPVFVYIVSPGYVKAMGMRLIEGRDISWDDLVENRNVVIINETVARKTLARAEIPSAVQLLRAEQRPGVSA